MKPTVPALGAPVQRGVPAPLAAGTAGDVAAAARRLVPRVSQPLPHGPAQRGEVRQAGADDGEAGLDGGPDEDGAHGKGDVGGAGQLREVDAAQDGGDADEAADEHQAQDGALFAPAHVERQDLRDRDREDVKVDEHVDDGQGEEEGVDVDADPRRARELRPKVRHRPAHVAHGHPDGDGIKQRQADAEVYGTLEGSAGDQVPRSKDAHVEEEDAQLDRAACAAVDEGVDIKHLVDLLDLVDVQSPDVTACTSRGTYIGKLQLLAVRTQIADLHKGFGCLLALEGKKSLPAIVSPAAPATNASVTRMAQSSAKNALRA